ncbi:MAG: ComF family protein [Bacteroidales bacterium]|jgi:ComF family protein|nr:ComF family protein [Bacteroidales bacterium]
MGISLLSEWCTGFTGLIYPNLCVCCASGLLRDERYICGHCLYELPETGFYREDGNPVERMFWGRVKVEHAAALYFFRKGNRIQTLVHQIKYKGQMELGECLGREMGKKLSSTAFAEVDMVVPVPLHPSKLKKRGYNQSEWIARGVCSRLEKPLNTSALVRRMVADSQTRKKRYERWENVESGFGLTSPHCFSGKHILLIDDVVTTGATLEACIRTVQYAGDVKVSIAALAFTTA